MQNKSIEERIEEVQQYAVQHTNAGHDMNDDLMCRWITSKGKRKCDCGFAEYEEMVKSKLTALIDDIMSEVIGEYDKLTYQERKAEAMAKEPKLEIESNKHWIASRNNLRTTQHTRHQALRNK